MVSMQIAIIHIYRSDTMKRIFTYILIFVITCWMFISLLINHQRQQIDFIAVGDNLIHPVVYQDANNGKDSYNFQKCTDQLLLTYKTKTLHILTKNHL